MLQALALATPLVLALPPPPPPIVPVTTPPDEIAFTQFDERMTVPVTIGATVEAGPYRFIVDTGAERTVISRELAGSLGLAAGNRVRITAMAGSGEVATFVIPRLTVGAANVGARLAGQRIEAPALVARNLGAAGLVGIDTLQGHALTIDFAKSAMTVAPATRRLRHESFGSDDIVVTARRLFGQLVVTDASYRGQRIRVVIDTGAVVSIGNPALGRLVAARPGKLTPITVTSVTGATLEASFTQIDDVRFADVDISNLPVAFADAPPFARLGLSDRPALLLGMDALRLFGRVRIDFANRELRFERPHGDAPQHLGISS